MNCDNTISNGFYFWIGKAFAELSIGLAVILVFTVLYIGIVWLSRRKK